MLMKIQQKSISLFTVERGGACGHVLQQLISRTTQMNSTVRDLSQGQKEAIRIAETDNSYWILLWVDNYDVVKNHNIIQQIAQELQVQPRTCQLC